MPEMQNQTNQSAVPQPMAQPTAAELQEELKKLKDEQSNFSPETDHWFILEQKIKKIEEQLKQPQ